MHLDGLTVVDFTQIGAGPTCTMLLADMGARVIKIESPDGELGRGLGPGWIGEDSRAVPRLQPQQARRVARPEVAAGGVAVAQAARSPAPTSSSRACGPGVMARLGPGLRAARRRASRRSSTARSRPTARPARMPTAPASTASCRPTPGLMSLIGLPKAREPCKVQAPIVDVMTGYVACMAVLAKLAQRARDGAGRPARREPAELRRWRCSSRRITSYFADGELPVRVGSAAPYSAPNQAFETARRLDHGRRLHARALDAAVRAAGPAASWRPTRASPPRRCAWRTGTRWSSALTAVLQHAHDRRMAAAAARGRHPVRARGELRRRGAASAGRGQRHAGEVQHPRTGTIRMPGFPVDSAQANAAAAPRRALVRASTRGRCCASRASTTGRSRRCCAPGRFDARIRALMPRRRHMHPPDVARLLAHR